VRLGGSLQADALARGGRGACVALGAALSTLVAQAPAQAATPADAVITALRIEQGRHCAVATAREPDGHPRVTVRGDFCDGRRFLKAVFAALAVDNAEAARLDIDLDIKVDALAGFNNEVLRDVSLRLAVRDRDIKAFALTATLGHADVSGRLRDGSDHRRALNLQADDAGALLRLVNVYRRVRGGRLFIAMSAMTPDGAGRDGVATLRDFAIADEPALRPLARLLLERKRRFDIARLRATFKSQAGRVVLSDGIVAGALIGATFRGGVDLARNRLDLDGLMIPIAVNNAPAPPIFLMGGGEGLLGCSYRLSGPLAAPELRLDPLSMLAPRTMRKLFEFTPAGEGLEP